MQADNAADAAGADADNAADNAADAAAAGWCCSWLMLVVDETGQVMVVAETGLMMLKEIVVIWWSTTTTTNTYMLSQYVRSSVSKEIINTKEHSLSWTENGYGQWNATEPLTNSVP